MFCFLCTNYFLAFAFLWHISGCENTKGALDVACYPFQGAVSEPHTAAVVTFIRLRLPAGNAHTHIQQNSKDIRSSVSTHWVMMGLSIPVKACSSSLDSCVESTEMDTDQEVLGLWFLFLQGHHVYSCRGRCIQPYDAVN